MVTMTRFFLPILLLVSFSANADVIVDEEFIVLTGHITKSDADTITALNPDKIEMMILNSRGGEYIASKEIASWVRHNDIDTMLDNNVGCYSGCSLIFQAGYPKRFAARNSILGYHPVRIEIKEADDNTFYLTNPGSTKEIRELYRAYGMKKECVDQIPSLKWDDWLIKEAGELANCHVVTDYIEETRKITYFPTNAVQRSQPGTLSKKD